LYSKSTREVEVVKCEPECIGANYNISIVRTINSSLCYGVLIGVVTNGGAFAQPLEDPHRNYASLLRLCQTNRRSSVNTINQGAGRQQGRVNSYQEKRV